MRKIVLSLAMSLDGYILDDKGKFDWITGDGDPTLNTEESFDFAAFLSGIEFVVMGRVSFEDAEMDWFKNQQVIVASRQKLEDHDNVIFVQDDIIGYVEKLQQEDGGGIFIYGGSILVDLFMKADCIDEFVIGVVPIILGSGKPLFLEDNPRVNLHLDRYTIAEGLTVFEYSRRREA